MTHPVHPTVLARYREMQRTHRSVLPAGELTAERQIQAIDRYGILSLAVELGEERVAKLLRVRVEQDAAQRDFDIRR